MVIGLDVNIVTIVGVIFVILVLFGKFLALVQPAFDGSIVLWCPRRVESNSSAILTQLAANRASFVADAIDKLDQVFLWKRHDIILADVYTAVRDDIDVPVFDLPTYFGYPDIVAEMKDLWRRMSDSPNDMVLLGGGQIFLAAGPVSLLR